MAGYYRYPPQAGALYSRSGSPRSREPSDVRTPSMICDDAAGRVGRHLPPRCLVLLPVGVPVNAALKDAKIAIRPLSVTSPSVSAPRGS